MFKLSQNSIGKLVGVHPDLIAIVETAIGRSSVDFIVVQGLRTVAEEKANVAKGASTTMHSRHLPNKQGLACAVDLAAMNNGKIAWVPTTLYAAIAGTMKAVAKERNIALEWGGDWHTFKDYGHFQLPWAAYP